MRESPTQQRGSRSSLFVPEYSGYDIVYPKLAGDTVLRILPAMGPDGEQPVMEAGAMSSSNFGDWGAHYEMVKFAGHEGTDFITEVTDPETKEVMQGQTPAKAHYWAIKNGVDDDPRGCPLEWHSWLKWDPNSRGCRVRSPSLHLLFQALLFTSGGEPIKDQDGQAITKGRVIVALNYSTQKEFIERLLKPVDPSNPVSAENNDIGDICSCAGGRIMTLTPPPEDKATLPWTASLGDPYPLDPEYVRSMWVPWNDLIRIPTVQESIQRLTELFDDASVDFALRSSPYVRYMPEKARGAWDR